MRKSSILLVTAAVTISVMAAGCTSKNDNKKETSKITEVQTEEGKVASGTETVEAVDVVEDGMEPVYGDSVKDGEYDVIVDSSSSMFKITACKLTVKEGKMTAVMTMSGTGYGKLYMGTAEDAANATEDEFIPYMENENGEYTFEVPVDALDEGIDCAAFSKKKEKWYDRVLLFRVDSLPTDALADGMVKTVQDLGIEDGTYTVDVTLAGGSGKASVESPAKIEVKDGTAYATIVFSSSHYDYMLVDDEKYLTVNTEGNSTFEIPVTGFDYKMPVVADTTAMSTPHEIEYTLSFDSASLKAE